MPDEPAQAGTPDPPNPASHFDALPYPHRRVLDAGLAWVIHQAFEALQQVEKGLPARYTGLVDDLPPRWRLRYDEAFLLRFAVCAVTVAYKMRTLPPADGYLTSCVAEELALYLAIEHAEMLLDLEAAERGEKWEDDFHLDAVLEYACTDRQYDALYATGKNRWPERALATVGIWERDLRYLSLLEPFDLEGLPPVHPYVDPDQEWWQHSPEPPPDDEHDPLKPVAP